MGETRNPIKLLLGSYVWNCYSLRWAEADDEKVRSLLKQLRIRPKAPGVEHVEYGDKNHYWHNSPFGNSGFFKALVTLPNRSNSQHFSVLFNLLSFTLTDRLKFDGNYQCISIDQPQQKQSNPDDINTLTFISSPGNMREMDSY